MTPLRPNLKRAGSQPTSPSTKRQEKSSPRPAPRVPPLALSELTDAATEALSPRSPIVVNEEGEACVSERGLRQALAAYHAHQAGKDVGAHLAALRAGAGGVRLIVGGERGPWEYRSPRGLFAPDLYGEAARLCAVSPTRPQQFTLNSDASALPHLWGDVASSATMMRFPDDSVDAVHFEYVPYSAFTSEGDHSLSDMYARHLAETGTKETPRLWSAESPSTYRSVRRGLDTFAHLGRIMRPGAQLNLLSGLPPESARAGMLQALADAGFAITSLQTALPPRTTRLWLAQRGFEVGSVEQGEAGAMRLRAVLQDKRTTDRAC